MRETGNDGDEHRSLELRGREQAVDAWVESLAPAAAPA
jgi:hypothetical protein